MIKTILLIMLAIVTIGGVSAQNIFFATKKGMILEYANLNNKGKVDNYTRLTIQNVEGSGNDMKIIYVSTVLNGKRQPVGTIEIPYTVTIVNGTVELDMKSYAAAGSEGLIEIEGDKIRIPPNLSPGVKLNDVNFTLTISMGIRIRTEISLTEHECLAIEEITVPAGTYTCYKMTQTNKTTAMRRTIQSKSITWYAPGIGSVKTENYNDKGQLQASTVLESVVN